MKAIKVPVRPVLISILLAAALALSAFAAIPSPSDVFYVYDEANVIDDETEEQIISKNVALQSLCGAQIVVAAVNTTGDTDIERYAYDMFNSWGIGDGVKNNGILILLSIEEDDYWVIQGKGLESTLQSGTIKLLNNDLLEPYFAKKQYSKGVLSLFDALVEKLEQIYSIDIDSFFPSETDTEQLPAQRVTIGSLITRGAGIVVSVTVIALLILGILIVASIAIGIFILIASAFNAERGDPQRRHTGRSAHIRIDPGVFNKPPRNTGYRPGGSHSSFNWYMGGSSGRSGFSNRPSGGPSRPSGGSFGSHSSGGFKGSSGGFKGSGGGGSSRGGGAGRR